jgi:DNA-binding transcriptional LysR family regulator
MKASTLNQLLIFRVIAEERSIRGAARRLGLAAPSVSQALRQLESHLGAPLCKRTTRRLELTEAGEQLVANAAGALDTVGRALEAVRDRAQEPSGRVGITLPHFVYQQYLQPVYAEFCQRYPGILLEVSITDATVDLLSEGYDVGIRFGTLIDPAMVALPLTPPIRDVLFCSPAYAAAHGLPRSPDELASHRMIRYRFITARQLSPILLEAAGQLLEIEAPTALIVNDTSAAVDAARKGLGIGRVPEPQVAAALAAGELLPVLPHYWRSLPGLYVYFMRDSQKARRVRLLIDFLRERIGTPAAPELLAPAAPPA